MSDTSRARLFFDEVLGKREDAFNFLASLLGGGEAAAENGWRDYKQAEFLSRVPPAEGKQRVKEIWSENLSAFANTGGGVLIWGIQTKGKIPDKLSLVADCGQLADILTTLTNDATDPYVAGVEVVPIKNPSDKLAGMVICYIPPSAFAPHQASWGERTYFIRAQDSNLPCPQPLLRNMFYPRAQARLEPDVKMTANQTPEGGIMVTMETRVRSLGPATAEVAMVSVDPRSLGKPTVFYDDAWEKIASNLVQCGFPLPPNLLIPAVIRISGILLANGASVVFTFFTNNTPAHYSTVSFTQDEVLKCVRENISVQRAGRSSPIFS
jgi:hypothetical protein